MRKTPEGRGGLVKRAARRYLGDLSKRRRPTMMNRFEKPQLPGEARIRYLDGDFQIEAPGTFVRCAVTGQVIPIDELKYWSVSRQEAYVDAQAALTRFQECGNQP